MSESLSDIFLDIFKFVIIGGLIVGGIWLISWYVVENRYSDISKELDNINRDMIAKRQTFDDAVSLLDYDNAFQAYSDYKALCDKLRIKVNNVPTEFRNRYINLINTLSRNAILCQENIETYSEALVTLRITKDLI